ncbi:MAG TPA: 3-oxoacyl-[acyl-carrier-protein] synthase III C-terminal domain-containing protein [bacterium]|nr:3-oxoacyl-[acyl-carrier-protein] synthase III C-terminal domain-containing protein [bacterium]
MKAWVSGLGSWHPSTVRRNDAWPPEFRAAARAGDRTFNDIPPPLGDAAALAERYLELEAIDPFLGARERRVAADGITAADAEYAAARAALEDAGVRADQIDAVISYTTVLDRILPPTAGLVAHRLGATRAVAFGTDAGCSTLITQLMMAAGMVEAGLARHVLLTQSHLILRAVPLLHPATPGLGDAATACVVGPRGRWRIVTLHAQTHGEFYDAVAWVRNDDAEDEAPWWKGGGDYRLGSKNRPQAKQLMRDTVQYGAQTLREAATKAKLGVEQLTHLFSVQPRGWIPGAIAQHLGLPIEAALTTYEKYAHLGACGPIVNWQTADRAGTLKPASRLALYAQGAGFTRGAAILEHF